MPELIVDHVTLTFGGLRIWYEITSRFPNQPQRFTINPTMQPYPAKVQRLMQRLYKSLNERDKRRYAAVEAAKLGHGGLTYISQLLNCDPKTVQVGLLEIENDDDLETSRQRKKGLDANP